MKKSRWLKPVCVVFAVILACAGALWYMAAHTLSFSTGRYLAAERGAHMLILDNSPIKLSSHTLRDDPFAGLESGDRILVLHDGIQESYPGGTAAYAVFRLERGGISDVPKDVLNELAELGWWVSADTQPAE